MLNRITTFWICNQSIYLSCDIYCCEHNEYQECFTTQWIFTIDIWNMMLSMSIFYNTTLSFSLIYLWNPICLTITAFLFGSTCLGLSRWPDLLLRIIAYYEIKVYCFVKDCKCIGANCSFCCMLFVLCLIYSRFI